MKNGGTDKGHFSCAGGTVLIHKDATDKIFVAMQKYY